MQVSFSGKTNSCTFSEFDLLIDKNIFPDGAKVLVISSTDSYDFKYAKGNIDYTSKFGKSLDEDSASRE